jgi:hypothetical protein
VTAPNYRRARRGFAAHAVIAGVFGVLCLPTGSSLLTDWPFATPTADVPPRTYAGSAVVIIGVDLALFALVASALLARAALAPALSAGGSIDPDRVAAARRWCGIGTALGLSGYGGGLVVGAVNSIIVQDALPVWAAFTSGSLSVLMLLIVRRGLARDLRWLPRA